MITIHELTKTFCPTGKLNGKLAWRIACVGPCSTVCMIDIEVIIFLYCRIKGEYMMGDCVDYATLRSSDLYQEFQNSTSKLVTVDLDSYTEQQRKAFFISILDLIFYITALFGAF